MTRYVRYRAGADAPAYGVLEADTIHQIEGNPFGSGKMTGVTEKLSNVKLLYPCEPPKIFAVGRNYKSHLGTRPAPTTPEIFYKPITCLQNPGDPIILPADSTDVHFEGELVLVIGRPARNLSVEQAPGVIFGITCGNDVSERQWQSGPNKDLQWWRAKGSDTFGPLGPSIVTGVDYTQLLLTTRLNGNIVQQQYTSDLLFDCHKVVSWISQWVTLQQGDIIYTGTPGSTSKLSSGDVVEVELQNVGVLRNPVA